VKSITEKEFLKLTENKLTPKLKERIEDNWYKDYFIITEEDDITVRTGKSYFGSGCYSANFYINPEDGLLEKQFIESGDNGFCNWREYKIKVQSDSIVSYIESDWIGGRRIFQSFIALCI